MAVRRVSNIEIRKRGLFTALYGHYDDVFIGKDLRKFSFLQQLFVYLREEGYQCILFYDANNGFHSFSQEDLLLFLNTETNNGSGRSDVERKQSRSSHIKSPLRSYRFNSEAAAQSPQPPNNPPSTNDNIIPPLRADGLNGVYKLRGLAQQFEHWVQLLKRTNIKSCIIIKSPTVANFDNQENYKTFFSDLLATYDNYINTNKIIVIYDGNNSNMMVEAFDKHYTQLFCSSFFKEKFIISEQELSPNVFFIKTPTKDEITNLYNRFRLINNYAITIEDFEKIIDGLHNSKKDSLKTIEADILNLQLKELSLENLVKSKLINSPEIEVDSQLLKNNLDKVVGQSQNTPIIIDKLQTHFNKKNRTNPLSFFLVGTSGVGKTFTTELIAESLDTSGYEFVEFRMTEFLSQADVWKLIGSATGYMGSDQRPQLFQRIRENNRLVILFDEIEKAHEDIIKTLLQLLDKGKLSWNNEEYNFKDCIIAFTSNAAREQFVIAKKKQLANQTKSVKALLTESSFQQELRDILTRSEAAKFSPEFCGRINTFLVYNPLEINDIIQATYNYIKQYIRRQLLLNIYTIDPRFLAEIAIEFNESAYGLRGLKSKIEDITNQISTVGNIANWVDLQYPDGVPTIAASQSKVSLTEAEEVILFESSLTVAKRLIKDGKKLDNSLLHTQLKRVIGQEDSCEPIIDEISIWIRRRVKPLTMFFVGPSGVGKTETAKQLAAGLSGNGYSFFRIDCNELSTAADINKIIGSPTGYIGSDTEPAIFREHRKNKKLVLLLDEIEKADPKIFTVLMSLLDEGRLSWNNDQRDFSSCIIIATSNLEQAKLSTLKSALKQQNVETNAPAFQEQTKLIIEAALKQKGLGSEIVGRINKVLIFNLLDENQIKQIAFDYIKRLVNEENCLLIDIEEVILSDLGENFKMNSKGARPLIDELNRIVKAAIYHLQDTADIDDDTATLKIALRKEASRGSLRLMAELDDTNRSECHYDFLSTPINSELPIGPIDPEPISSQSLKVTLQISELKNEIDNLDNSIGLLTTGNGIEDEGGYGTGFIFSSDGYVLTAHHVIEDKTVYQLSINEKKDTYDLDLVWCSPIIDIAILKIKSEKKDFSPLEIYTAAETPIKGETVILLGYPLGGSLSDTPFRTENQIVNYQVGLKLQGDLSFDTFYTYSNGTNGYSGGPLIRKSDNKVIGILHGGFPNKGNINLASDIRQLFKQADLEIIMPQAQNVQELKQAEQEQVPVEEEPAFIISGNPEPDVINEEVTFSNANHEANTTLEAATTIKEKYLPYDFIIVDTNIWIDKDKRCLPALNTLLRICEKEQVKMRVLDEVYEEIHKQLRKSNDESIKKQIRWAENTILSYRKKKVIIIDKIKIQEDKPKDIYADPHILKTFIQLLSDSKKPVLITNDRDLLIRTFSHVENIDEENYRIFDKEEFVSFSFQLKDK